MQTAVIFQWPGKICFAFCPLWDASSLIFLSLSVYIFPAHTPCISDIGSCIPQTARLLAALRLPSAKSILPHGRLFRQNSSIRKSSSQAVHNRWQPFSNFRLECFLRPHLPVFCHAQIKTYPKPLIMQTFLFHFKFAWNIQSGCRCLWGWQSN